MEASAEASAEGDTTAAMLKACEVTDIGGVDDKGFNQKAYKGVQDAVAAGLDAATFEPTCVRLGPAVDVGLGGRRGDRTLFVPATGADDLAPEVNRVTRHLGDEPIRPRFLGHVTLARVKARANMPRALGTVIDADWQPERVALVESTLHPDGARYDTLQTWPIGTD